MRSLSFNRLAFASIRARRREYLTLAIGIMLAIVLVFSLLLIGSGMYAHQVRSYRKLVGEQDALLFDMAGQDPAQLMRRHARQVGIVTMLGTVQDSDFAVGYYDEAAAQLLNRGLVEGRLPIAPQELAVEQSMLARLRITSKVGDTLSLALKPFSEGNAAPVARRDFTLVGILTEQSQQQGADRWASADPGQRMPAALAVAQPPLTGARSLQHWLLKLQPGIGDKRLRQVVQDSMGLSRYPQMFAYDPLPDANSNPAVVILILLGASLLLCTGIGILNAFANRLSQREQQIGMLRAVGATRRQIRVIYGREAMLLALVTAPLALLLSLGLALLVLRSTLKAPLSFPWWLLPVGLLLSMGIILLSAALPLRSASRLTPLAVLRNLPLMLKRQRLKVKSQRYFDPPRLLAGRAARLGSRSLTGISLLILLCMLTLSILCSIPYTLNLYRDPNVEPGAFSVYANAFGNAVFSGTVDVMRRDGGIQEADAEGLRGLPAVKRVSFTARQHLTLLKDLPSDYLTMEGASALQAIYHEQEWRSWHPFPEEEIRRWLDNAITEYRDLQRRLGTEQDILGVQVLAVDAERLNQLAPYVTEGALNLDRINRGEEVLFMAPVKRMIRDREGHLQNIGWEQQDKPVELTLSNQDFKVGDRLDLRQLYIYPEDLPENHRQSDELWQKVHMERMNPAVGAVLMPDRGQTAELVRLLRSMAVQFITTMEGLQALGMKHQGLSEVEVFLSRDITPAEEQLIDQELKLVASRGADGQVFNRLEYARQSRRNHFQAIAVFVALLLVFLTLCQSLINNHLTGMLRAQRRAIGSLRALGADERALRQSYAHQLLRLMLTGVIPGIVLSAALAVQLGLLNYKPLPGSYFLFVAFGEALLVLLMFLLSSWHLRRRLHRLLNQPIIEQIREIG